MKREIASRFGDFGNRGSRCFFALGFLPTFSQASPDDPFLNEIAPTGGFPKPEDFRGAGSIKLKMLSMSCYKSTAAFDGCPGLYSSFTR